MARRDEILEYAAEILDLDAHPDYGPMGMQVVGAEEVKKIACGVSASRTLFERAAAAKAQLLLVHHGLFWDRDQRIVDTLTRGRLEALFAGDVTLAVYHLALDAHPEIGNNTLLALELGIEPERRFAGIGWGGPVQPHPTVERFVGRVREKVGREPLVFPHGPPQIRRVALVTGGGGRFLADAAAEGYDAFVTGEAEESSLHASRELGIHFVAAGHYATERLGVQALAEKLAERFDVDWEFIELGNPV